MSDVVTNLLRAEYDTQGELALARDALAILSRNYPGYDWDVKCMQGILQIKLPRISSTWGMIRHVKAIDFDAVVFSRDIIRSGGEFLERCKARRAQRDFQAALKSCEGVPEKELSGI